MLSSETFSTGKVVNYSYNGSGNRASMTEMENGQSTVTKYVYDELNRLTRHYTESPNGDTDRTYYSYDEDGNLILRSRENATTGTATDTFSFGMTSPNVDTFKYNGYGEMSQAVVGGVTTNYTYYADGLRRTKTTNGVTTVHMWDGDNIIADLDGNYALKTGYARANDLSTMYNADGDEWYYIMSDRGDTIQMYNDTTETNYLYDAYGNQQTETAADINPFRYSGEYYDAETGFTYLRARYYDPTIGRFISEDPIRDGLNWYAYCENNPVMYVDPTGLWMLPITIYLGSAEPLKTFEYDREKAAEYAQKWAESRNPDYPDYRKMGGDCTNFVSQALYAGGLPQDGKWKTYWFFKTKTTREWDNAQQNYNYFSDPENEFTNGTYTIKTKDDVKRIANGGKVQIGDIMYFKSNSTGKIGHATMITKIEDGEIYYSQHSSQPYLNNALAGNRFGDNEEIGYTMLIVTIKDYGGGYVVK